MKRQAWAKLPCSAVNVIIRQGEYEQVTRQVRGMSLRILLPYTVRDLTIIHSLTNRNLPVRLGLVVFGNATYF